MGRRIDVISSNAGRLTRTPEVFATGADPRPLSVNLWHRPETLSPASLACLWANEQTGGPAIAMTIADDGFLKFYSGGYGSVVTAALSTLITVDEWHMFTLTWASDNTYKLYVNGVERASGSLARTYGSSDGNSILGGLNSDTANYYAQGDYAEFAAWDSVLTGEQVASLFTGAESGLAATLVGSPAHYAPLLGVASPEPETVGGDEWVIVGTVPASTTIGSSPAHPTISSSVPATFVAFQYRNGGILAGSTGVSTYVYLQTTAGAPATALAFGDVDASYLRSGVAAVTATLMAGTAGGTWGAGKFSEVDATNCPGLYRIDWPDAAFAAGAAESVTLSVTGTGLRPVHDQQPLQLDQSIWGGEAITGATQTEVPTAGLPTMTAGQLNRRLLQFLSGPCSGERVLIVGQTSGNVLQVAPPLTASPSDGDSLVIL